MTDRAIVNAILRCLAPPARPTRDRSDRARRSSGRRDLPSVLAIAWTLTAWVAPTGAWATIWPPTRYELSEIELVDAAIGRAGAIVTAIVGDTGIACPPRPDGAWATARILRVLKGPSLPSRLCVGFDTTIGEQYRNGVSRRMGIVFLRRTQAGWVVAESPYTWGGGIVDVDARTREAAERTVIAALRRASLDTLVARSALIAIGTAMEKGDWKLHVDEVIAGRHEADTVLARNPFSYGKGTRYLVFLRRGPHGHETVHVTLGRLEIEDGIVRGLDQPLDAVLRRIRILRWTQEARRDRGRQGKQALQVRHTPR
jgi:hypothetical protein